jgi:hypothetical protein
MQQTWYIVLAAAQNGEGLKNFLQGWSGPIFLAGLGFAALAVLLTGEGASRAIRLGILAIVGAIFIYKPEVFPAIGGAVAAALGF